MAGRLAERIAGRARRFGPLPWSAFMEAALYDPDDGFYQAGGRAGRHGADFVTSPELGPLFAAVVARALDEVWVELGRPDPFVVVEAAAGAGTMARDVLAAAPACAPALRYVLVERSAALRAEQAARLPIEMPALVLGPTASGDGGEDGEDAAPVPGRGPLVTSLAELPALSITGVVLANELVDNLPVDLLEWREGRWHEVRVAAAPAGTAAGSAGAPDTAAGSAGAPDTAAGSAGDPDTAGLVEAGDPDTAGLVEAGDPDTAGLVEAGDPDTAGLVEMLVPASPEVAAEAARLVGESSELADGARIPRQRAAVDWVRQALTTLEAGRLIVIDYADTTEALARRPWGDWLRTFQQHQAALFPLHGPGTQDITCVVAWDQLAALRPPDRNQPQEEWLAEHGLPELVEAARAVWRERASLGDLAALVARSRVNEGAALADPRGLGGHRVLQWTIA